MPQRWKGAATKMTDKVMAALWAISVVAWLALLLGSRHAKRRTDSLTGVYGVEYFHRYVRRLIEKKKEFHLVTLELRQLKKINRLRGTHCGDQLLVCTASRLRLINRWNPVFRITGRRFMVLTHTLNEYENVLHAAQTIFAQPVEVEGEKISSTTVVCGVRDAAQMHSSGAVLEYVEYLTALAGDGTESLTVQGDEETLKGFRYMQGVESFLETALEQDLFEVQYQPVYSLEKGRYVTLEALSRLRHPTLGPVAPDVFISLAEKSDQMTRLGLLQMRRICRFVRENPQLMECVQNIKINLSPEELMKNGHVERLIEIIGESGLPTSFFQFEITETTATEYSDQFRQTAEKFTQAGIGLCLDDFGSGFANLNTVLKFPFSAIKLDKSLLNGIDEDSRVAMFYRNIVAVLKNMGYYVIAEGVETTRELELVSRWGIDMIQGYYFAKPLRAQDVLESVKTGRIDAQKLKRVSNIA